MKYRLLILIAVIPMAMSQMVLGADNKHAASAGDGVSRLPFDRVAPLPGALALSADGRIAAHIGVNGDVVIWDADHARTLETIPAGEKKPGAIALSTDGALIAIGYPDARLVIRSRPDKKPVREFRGHSGGISALALSLDGKMLASGGDDGTTQTWDVASGKRLHVLDSLFNGDISSGSGIPVAIGFSGNGRVLVVNEWHNRHYDIGRSITLWDIDEGIEISARDIAPPNRDGVMRSGQALGGNGWLLAYTGGWLSGKKGLMVERLDRCESARQLSFGGFDDTVAADPQGRWVAAAGDDDRLTFAGMSGELTLFPLSLPGQAVALVAHPDGRSIFALLIAENRQHGNERSSSASGAGTTAAGALYRIPVPSPLWKLPPLQVREAASPCATTAAWRTKQDFRLPEKPFELRIVAKLVPTMEMTTDPDNPTGEYNQINPPRELYFGQEGNLHVLHHAESDFRSGVAVWNVQTGQLLRSRFRQYVPNKIIRLRVGWGAAEETLIDLLTGRRFSSVSNDDDKSIHLDLRSDEETGQIFRRTAKRIERFDGAGIRLPDIETGASVVDYVVRNGRLAALYEKGRVQVWQLEPPGASKTYNLGLSLGDGEWAETLALSADGRYLQLAFPNASGDGPTGYATYRLGSAGKVGDSESLAPLPLRANRGVVSASRPNHLDVWDYDAGAVIARLPRQRSRSKEGAYVPLRAAISAEGRFLASASHDGLVRIWDLDRREMMGEGRAGGAISTMAFDPVGRLLAAGRNDGQVVVFRVPDSR